MTNIGEALAAVRAAQADVELAAMTGQLEQLAIERMKARAAARALVQQMGLVPTAEQVSVIDADVAALLAQQPSLGAAGNAALLGALDADPVDEDEL